MSRGFVFYLHPVTDFFLVPLGTFFIDPFSFFADIDCCIHIPIHPVSTFTDIYSIRQCQFLFLMSTYTANLARCKITVYLYQVIIMQTVFRSALPPIRGNPVPSRLASRCHKGRSPRVPSGIFPWPLPRGWPQRTESNWRWSKETPAMIPFMVSISSSTIKSLTLVCCPFLLSARDLDPHLGSRASL